MNNRFLRVLAIMLLMGLSLTSATALAEHADRSKKQQAILIGGSTAAGTVLGAMIGGKKGALAGAVAGAAGSAIYNEATKEDQRDRDRTNRDKLVIIGGSAGAGAAAGGIAGGKKGALIGAAIGATAGYVLHKKTDKDGRRFF